MSFVTWLTSVVASIVCGWVIPAGVHSWGCSYLLGFQPDAPGLCSTDWGSTDWGSRLGFQGLGE